MFDLHERGKRCAALDLRNRKDAPIRAALRSRRYRACRRGVERESALAGIGRAGMRERVVVDIDDGAVPGGSAVARP